MSERRTPAKPGLRSYQQWPTEHVVEYGPAEINGETTKGFTPKSYKVYIDGEYAGTVSVKREPQTRPISKGSRIVTHAGYRQVWRETGVRVRGAQWKTAGAPSRVEATARLVQNHLGLGE